MWAQRCCTPSGAAEGRAIAVKEGADQSRTYSSHTPVL
jgi:hypothetical protein